MLEQPLIREWLFTAEAPVLKPQLSLDGQPIAFHLLTQPKELKELLSQEMSENQLLSIIRKIANYTTKNGVDR
tara:strand:- start:225 stop:443 length:219 start_codon:yes stop_codon:yes gene_type:complete